MCKTASQVVRSRPRILYAAHRTLHGRFPSLVQALSSRGLQLKVLGPGIVGMLRSVVIHLRPWTASSARLHGVNMMGHHAVCILSQRNELRGRDRPTTAKRIYLTRADDRVSWK